MTKQQKRNLISNIFFYVGAISINLSIIGFVISFILINDNNIKGVFQFISLILLIVFVILVISLGFIDYRFSLIMTKLTALPVNYGFKGVPRNKFKEFYIPKEYITNQLIIREVSRNIFEVKIKDKVFVYNMVGWNKPIKYVSQLILAELQIIYGYGKRKLVYRRIYVDYENINLRFIRMNEKIIDKMIVKKNMTRLSLSFRIDLWSRVGLISGTKISFKQIYDFNY